jgi:hypothetical protein
MVQPERSSTFVAIPCSCGKILRAKAEQIGTEVRCWNCHQMVPVPNPHQAQRVARELSDGALTVINGPGLNSVLVGTAVVTALLAIPSYGVWFSAIALTMGASAYGESIRRIGRGPTEEPDPGLLSALRPASIGKFALCSLMAAGTVVPLWLLNARDQQSPHWSGIGGAIAALAWIVVPLLMLAVYGRTDQDAPIGVRGALRLLARHPIASILALSVVPMTLLLLEVGLGVFLYLTGNLPFFALDFMPMPTLAPIDEAPVLYDGIPYYHMIEYTNFPDSLFYRGYFDGLRKGYSLVGAMPASLSMPTRHGLDANRMIGLPWPFYTVFRLLFIALIVTCLLAAFAIQARWLGSIPALERRKST